MEILVNNVAQLKLAFNSAKDGDIIKMASGEYGKVTLQGGNFKSGVTITSENPNNPAVFTDALTLLNVTGVTVSNIDLDADSLIPHGSYSHLQILKSENVTLRDMSIEGHIPTANEDDPDGGRLDPHKDFAHGTGVQVRWSEGVTLDNVEITDVRVALQVSDTVDSSFTNLNIHDVREGMNIVDVDKILVEDSWFHDMQNYRNDHTDMIQYWGINYGVSNLTIRDNLMENPEGTWSQAIFGHFRAAKHDDVTATNFTITGNTISNGHQNAIRLSDVDGLEISDNILLPNSDNYHRSEVPKILLMNGVENAEISDNYLMQPSHKTVTNLSESQLDARNIDLSGNRFLSSDPKSNAYWGKLVKIDPRDNTSEGGPEEAEDPTPNNGDDPVVVPPNPNPGVPSNPNPGPETDGPVNTDIDNTISGNQGANKLRDVRGNTELTGKDGADRFFFDYRQDTKPAHDVVTDLDFSDGDRLVLIGKEKRTFDNSVDPDNRLLTYKGGASVHIRSIDDLMEAAAGGGIFLSGGDGGKSTVITLADAPGRTIELKNLAYDGPEEPTNPEPQVGDDPVVVPSNPNPGPETDGPVNTDIDNTISGNQGANKLHDARGNTELTGKDGADRFIFDYRQDTKPTHDIITDLNFSEGDRLMLIGKEKGTFDNSVDPDNRLLTYKGGARAQINSIDDLVEAVMSGGISLSNGEGGKSTIITLNEAPDRTIELMDFAYDDPDDDENDLAAMLI